MELEAKDIGKNVLRIGAGIFLAGVGVGIIGGIMAGTSVAVGGVLAEPVAATML